MYSSVNYILFILWMPKLTRAFWATVPVGALRWCQVFCDWSGHWSTECRRNLPINCLLVLQFMVKFTRSESLQVSQCLIVINSWRSKTNCTHHFLIFVAQLGVLNLKMVYRALNINEMYILTIKYMLYFLFVFREIYIYEI